MGKLRELREKSFLSSFGRQRPGQLLSSLLVQASGTRHGCADPLPHAPNISWKFRATRHKTNSAKPQLYKYLGPPATTLPPGSLGPLSMCAATKGETLEPHPHPQWAPGREQLQLLSHGVAAGVQQRSWFFKQPLRSSLRAALEPWTCCQQLQPSHKER